MAAPVLFCAPFAFRLHAFNLHRSPGFLFLQSFHQAAETQSAVASGSFCALPALACADDSVPPVLPAVWKQSVLPVLPRRCFVTGTTGASTTRWGAWAASLRPSLRVGVMKQCGVDYLDIQYSDGKLSCFSFITHPG